MGNLIDINGLRKSYNEKAVLKGINLTVNRGEVIAIIGASGSGKSTLVRCIANLEPYQNGSINICGKKNSDYKSLSGILGMVFQNYNLFPHYTVLENITQPLQVVMKYSVTDAEKRAKKLLERVRLIDYINQYPSTLSGGQKQRLAIARALAMDPKIIIFDEPTSSLDPELAHEVFSTINELALEGQTMLIVTHQINAIRHFATRVLFLNNGIIEEDGTGDEIFCNTANENLSSFLKMVEFDDLY
ncbi:amino acid ABC transporter ATP-binding protein [Mogibacterium diversum]|uniref:amino acid ABC transporter ATP-binding protein n=1 Tax=Mogibacterium diversum TaxID=114527 RepID=UPI0028D09D4D|nr:amino acid ABC transporter ATP-binding protein [Mogibacterium diversum]